MVPLQLAPTAPSDAVSRTPSLRPHSSARTAARSTHQVCVTHDVRQHHHAVAHGALAVAHSIANWKVCRPWNRQRDEVG